MLLTEKQIVLQKSINLNTFNTFKITNVLIERRTTIIVINKKKTV